MPSALWLVTEYDETVSHWQQYRFRRKPIHFVNCGISPVFSFFSFWLLFIDSSPTHRKIRIRFNVMSKPSFTSTVGNVTSSDRIAPLTQVTECTIRMKTQYRIARTHTYANRKHTARLITPRTANDNSSSSSSSSSSNNDKNIQMIHRTQNFSSFFFSVFILFYFFFCLVTNQTEEK